MTAPGRTGVFALACALAVAVVLAALLPTPVAAQEDEPPPTPAELVHEMNQRIHGVALDDPTPELCRFASGGDSTGVEFSIDMARVAAGFACDSGDVAFGLVTTSAWSLGELDFAEWFIDADGDLGSGCVGAEFALVADQDERGEINGTLYEVRSCDPAQWTFQGDALLRRDGAADFLGAVIPNGLLGNPDLIRFFAVTRALADDGSDIAPDRTYVTLTISGGPDEPTEAPLDDDPQDIVPDPNDYTRFTCVGLPDEESGDVFFAQGEDAGQETGLADVTDLCARLIAEELTVQVLVAQPTDPELDRDEEGDEQVDGVIWRDPRTFLDVVIDVNPDRLFPEIDFTARLQRRLIDGAFTVVTTVYAGDVRLDDTPGEPLCVVQQEQALAPGGYLVIVPTECMRTQERVRAVQLGAAMQLFVYEEDSEDVGGDTVTVIAPNELIADCAPGDVVVEGGEPVACSGLPDEGKAVYIFPTFSVSPENGLVQLTDGIPTTTERLERRDPVGIAERISKAVWPSVDPGEPLPAGAAAYAVLARDDVFADALAGSSLAMEGPLLFAQRTQVADSTLLELERVLGGGGRLYLLGNEFALSGALEETLERHGFEVVRLGGPTRIQTAVEIAEELRRLRGPAAQVLVARAFGPEGDAGAVWADSMAGGVYAAFHGVPVLLTPTDELHPDVAAALAALDPDESVVLGGPRAVSDAVLAALPNSRRVAGPDRTTTAVAIADQLWALDPTQNFLLTNGYRDDAWVFALAAASYSARWSVDGAPAPAPLLLTQESALADATRAELAEHCADVLILGDTDVIDRSVELLVNNADIARCREEGAH